MLKKVDDIKKALDAKAYLAALALALTLPDICGRVAYPEIRGKGKAGERYKKWFNEKVESPVYIPDEYKEKEFDFDGDKCWKLRNAFLHAGNIKNQDGSEIIENFQLCITPIESGCYGASLFSASGTEGSEIHSVWVDVGQLCFHLYSAAKIFYERQEDKSKFDDHKVQIVSMREEGKGTE